MKIYTRTGDGGETGLLGGARVSKASERVAACGEVDELNAVLGLVLSFLAGSGEEAPGEAGGATGAAGDAARSRRLRDQILRVQHTLFAIGAELATDPQGPAVRIEPIGQRSVEELEDAIDRLSRVLTPLRRFVLPGGARVGAALHLARTVCRRAERAVVRVHAREPVNGAILGYLNRLSDLLFVMARVANVAAGVEETPWGGHAGGGAS